MLRLARCSAQPRPQLASLRHARCFASARHQGQDVAVIGGGLTGLTTAYYLAKNLPPSARITIYEASDRLGGWIWTDRVPVDVQGIRGIVNFERGPRTLTSLKGNAWRYDDLVLYDLMLNLGLDAEYPRNLPRYIYYPDHLVKMPQSIADVVTCISEPLFRECIPGLIGAAINWMLTKPGSNHKFASDISVADFFRHVTKGEAVGNNLVSAMIHGIYGGNIESLSMSQVLAPMHTAHAFWGDPVGKGFVRTSKDEYNFMRYMTTDKMICQLANKPKDSLIHFGARGLEALPKALEEALAAQQNVVIQRRSPVTRIVSEKRDKKLQVTTNNQPRWHDHVISTTSSQQLVKATGQKLSAFAGINSVSIMTVNLWYPFENMKPPGFGYLIPRSVPPEQNPESALGVFFDSDVIRQRGPDEPPGTKLFVLMGGHYYEGREPPSEEEAVRQAKALLERHLGIPRETPCHAMARLARDCIPQHERGHRALLEHGHDQLLREFGGKLTVASGSYGRVGVMGALRNGWEAAACVIDDKGAGLGAMNAFTVEAAVVPKDTIPCRAPQNRNH